jgi:RES domain-containing protein
MRVWRISNFADLSGRGGLIGDGRWHFRGTLIVYCSDHPSTALLEILAHANRLTVPDSYQLIEIDLPDDVEVTEPKLKAGWQSDKDFTRETGSRIFLANRFGIVRVPSVVMPKASNYLINPLHQAASRTSVTETQRYPFDSRLFGPRYN